MATTRYQTLEKMAEALNKANQIIDERKPDTILSPMMGAVPFIDVLNVINPEFDNNKVEYIPASSKLYASNETIKNWFMNFMKSNPEGKSILSLDEVVSGSSATRVYQQYDRAVKSLAKDRVTSLAKSTISGEKQKALQELTELVVSGYHIQELGQQYLTSEGKKQSSKLQELRKEIRNELKKRFQYNTIGLEDQKMERANKTRQKEYLELKKQGIVLPIPILTIVTMDQPKMCPAQYRLIQPGEVKESKKIKGQAFPIVEEFRVTKDYLEFLQTLARIMGTDPNEINPVNQIKILEAHKYLDSEFLPQNMR